MSTQKELEHKSTVNEAYSKIAQELLVGNNASCCEGDACCEPTNAKNEPITLTNKLPSLGSDKDLRGFANPKIGETVVDLGSGPGRDVLTYAQIVGTEGKAIGIDFSDDMLKLANKHAWELGVKNVDFIKGSIENIPLEAETADLIISNCVINLAQKRQNVFHSAYQVLKDGGRMVFSDLVVKDQPSEDLAKNADAVCGCFAGTTKENYLEMMKQAGFKNVEAHDEYTFTKNFSGSEVHYTSSIFSGVK